MYQGNIMNVTVVVYIVCVMPLVIGLFYYLVNHKEIKRNSEIYKKRDYVVQLLVENRWDDAFDYLEKERPWLLDISLGEFCRRTGCEGIDDLMRPEQIQRYKWLESSKRRVDYYMQIPDEEMTDEDWADLRASDF